MIEDIKEQMLLVVTETVVETIKLTSDSKKKEEFLEVLRNIEKRLAIKKDIFNEYLRKEGINLSKPKFDLIQGGRE